MSKPTITFRTAAQAMLFDAEIKGQISDGAWENSRNSCYETWCRAEVAVGENVGRDFHVGRDGFNLHLLLEFVGDRMLDTARSVYAFPGITYDEVRRLDSRHSLKNLSVREASDRYWLEVQANVDRFGGVAAVDAKLAAVAYDTKALRKDLTEMKKTMKIRKAS